MKLIDLLAHAQGRKDEQPNIALAEKIIKSNDENRVSELVELLQHKTTAVRHDVIKVLYEIGERRPAWLVPHHAVFIELLSNKNNRMRWGAMSALAAISKAKPEALTKHLVGIVQAMDEGSVITRDGGMTVLSNITKLKRHYADGITLLFEQLEKAPVNQFPMYAEKTAEAIAEKDKPELMRLIRSRTDVWNIPSKARRLEKLLRQC